jgi:hypothetical protein
MSLAAWYAIIFFKKKLKCFYIFFVEKNESQVRDLGVQAFVTPGPRSGPDTNALVTTTTAAAAAAAAGVAAAPLKSFAARVRDDHILGVTLPAPSAPIPIPGPVPVALEVPPGHTDAVRKKMASLREQHNFKLWLEEQSTLDPYLAGPPVFDSTQVPWPREQPRPGQLMFVTQCALTYRGQV